MTANRTITQPLQVEDPKSSYLRLCKQDDGRANIRRGGVSVDGLF